MTDKFKKRVREHAEKHGMSYQAALQQLSEPKTAIVHRDLFNQMKAERDEARKMAMALRSEAGWEETWPLPWESVDGTRKVIVNGRPAELPAEATYEDVVEVAFPGQSAFVFTVVYRGVLSSGSMWPKKSVRVEEGMIFSVADTSNA